MKKNTIAIIGGGNMGRAFAEGLARSKTVLFKSLTVADPDMRGLRQLKNPKLLLTQNNSEAVQGADIIILAVKPQIIFDVLGEIKNGVGKDTLVISIAAGISMKKIERLLPKKTALVRVMPNLCAKIGKSASVWVANKNTKKSQITSVKQILGSIGAESELPDEKMINVATAISGSGPAYVFYLAELLASKAETLGLPKTVSEKIVIETILGSALMLGQNTISPAELRRAVTSKGGTTEATFKAFDRFHFARAFSKGIEAAVKRAKELDR